MLRSAATALTYPLRCLEPPDPPPAQGRRRRLTSLQIMRGLAAWMVVFHHIAALCCDPATTNRFNSFARAYGHFGVDVFFIISGFVMYDSVRNSPSAIAFLGNRVARIVPNYWIFTLLTAGILAIIPDCFTLTRLEWPFLLQSLTFIPASNPAGSGYFPLLTVGWTINQEAFFYAVCAIACLARSPALRIHVVITIILVVNIVLNLWLQVNGSPLSFFARPTFLIFVVGMLCAALHERQSLDDLAALPRLFILLLLGFASYSCFRLGIQDHGTLYIVMGSALAVIGLLSLENTRLLSSWAAAPLIRLGDCSYSTYLCHVPIIVVAVYAFPSLRTCKYHFLILTLVLPIALVSEVCYRMVEKRLGNMLIGKRPRQDKKEAVAT
ncbi:MAG: acyltransferase [Planctomycetes bacterium]|nr:acyltransferase [Planctomycetota bacterium]